MTTVRLIVEGAFPGWDDWTRTVAQNWLDQTQSPATVIGLGLHSALTDPNCSTALLRYPDDSQTVLETRPLPGAVAGSSGAFEVTERPADTANHGQFRPEMLSRALILDIPYSGESSSDTAANYVEALTAAGISHTNHIRLVDGYCGTTDPSYVVGFVHIQDTGHDEWVVIVIRNAHSNRARIGIRRVQDPTDKRFLNHFIGDSPVPA